MNQKGWSLSSYIGYAVILLVFILIIAFNVIRLSNIGVVKVDNSGTVMKGENNLSDYSSAEKVVVDALKGYRADKYKKSNMDDTLIVTVRDLVSSNYMRSIVVDGVTCSGYGIIKKEVLSYSYESYIKCGNYTTQGYTSSLDK